jgi:hypothetical protein
VSNREDVDRIRDPLEEGEDKANRTGTSGNREESMTESGKDAFGRGSAVRNPDSTEQGDGTSDDTGRQSPRESGTTPLGGEPSDAGDRKEPGGVEGRE